MYGFLQGGEKFCRMCLAMVLVHRHPDIVFLFPAKLGRAPPQWERSGLIQVTLLRVRFRDAGRAGEIKEKEERGSFSYLLIFFLSKSKVIPGILSSTYLG